MGLQYYYSLSKIQKTFLEPKQDLFPSPISFVPLPLARTHASVHTHVQLYLLKQNKNRTWKLKTHCHLSVDPVTSNSE